MDSIMTLTSFSNDSINSRSSFESGFYNNLSRSQSPIDTQDLGSPTYENRSLAELMVSAFDLMHT